MSKKGRRAQPPLEQSAGPDAAPQAPERDTVKPSFGSHGWTFAVVAITIAAAALRFADLGGKSLWFDEALSIADSVSLSSKFGSGYHPPLFYYVLHALIAVFGDSPSVVRLVAAVPGTLTVLALAIATRRLFGDRAALLAAIVLAVSSLHVEYSQEVRMYALATLFLTVATIAASHLFRDDGPLAPRREWTIAVLYTAGAYLAMATHYLAVFVVAAQALALIVCWSRVRSAVAKLALLQVPALVAAGAAVAFLGYSRRIGVAAEFFANRGGVNQTIFSDIGQHALQVHMHHCVLRRMHLHILDDGLLVLAIHLDGDDAGIEALVLDDGQQLQLVQRDVRRFTLATIEDGRHLARATQAAARTLALVVARLGANYELLAH